jgi:glycosyltransferase involved in cell wall biosynthesis
MQESTRRQTILMIASTSFFSDYGCHVRILEEIRALQKAGHRVVLTTYHNGDDLPGIEIYRSWDVPWIKRAMVGSSRHKVYLDVGLSWRSLRVGLWLRPTIIHAHTHEAGLMGAVLKRVLRVPLILDYQGSMTHEMLDHGFISRRSPVYRVLLTLENRINRLADAIVTSTYNAAALLRRDNVVDPQRLYTVIDSVNTDRFRPFDGSPEWDARRRVLREQLGIPPGRRVVVYLGLLAPYQGTNVLLQAAHMLAPRLPDVHFLIMGYPDPSSYEAYAQSLGIADRVTLPGRIFYRDAHEYLALGDVAVAPKMSQTEGSGKISNYMAMGLPVVTFDTPVSREMLGDTGIYAAMGSASDLADKLALVLDDGELAVRLGQAGRRRAVADFSWDESIRHLEHIYEYAQQAREVVSCPGACLHPRTEPEEPGESHSV